MAEFSTSSSTPVSHRLATLLLLLFVQVLQQPLTLALSLPACGDGWQQSQGYTYTLDPATGKKVWSFCEFPDPRYDHVMCGLPSDWSEPSFLCDPDNLIGSSQTAHTINTNLASIQTKTPKQCSGPNGVRQGFIVIVILVDVIRVGDPFATDSCQNTCGEIYPTVNSTRSATEGEINVAMEAMADGLRTGLGIGACGNDLLLLYSDTYKKVHISMGSKVGDVLDTASLSDISSQFITHVNNGQLAEALLYVTNTLKSQLRGITPAMILIIITVIAAAFLLAFLLFYLHVSDTDYNVWGHEGASKMADVVVKSATGAYLIGWVFKATAHVSGRMPVWPIVVMLVAGIGCLVAAFTTNNVYTRLKL